MVPTDRLPTHPGEMLREEFLKPLGITQVRFAKHLGISLQRLNELIQGKRGMTPQTAWLLAEALGTSPEVWLNLQTHYDLAKHRPKERVKPLVVAAHGRRPALRVPAPSVVHGCAG